MGIFAPFISIPSFVVVKSSSPSCPEQEGLTNIDILTFQASWCNFLTMQTWIFRTYQRYCEHFENILSRKVLYMASMSQENVLLRKVLYMASIIKDASMVDVGRSRHTDPAWLWGFFLPSCASRVVAVVNTFAPATLFPTRARDSTLAMVFQCALFWRWALVGSRWPAPILQTRRERKSCEGVGQRCSFRKSMSLSCYLFFTISCFSLPHQFP